MLTIPWTQSGGTVTAYVRGVPHTIDTTHVNYKAVVEALQKQNKTVDELLKLLSVRTYIAGLNIGNVKVAADAILYRDQVVHSHLTNRMLDLLSQGIDVAPWAKFMDNLYNNPSKTAIDELYLWMQKANLPITEDGHFLAYKKVADDYTSYHKNADGSEFMNAIGTWVSMPRNQVDDRRDNTCSQGLHFCSWHYLPEYMGSSGRVLIVKINPADVVSIPSDYDNAKGRAWRYFIQGEVDRDAARHAFEGKLVVWTSSDEADYCHDEDCECRDEDDGYYDWKDAVEAGDTTLGFEEWKKSTD
jgi:hypothetical protein